MQNPTNQILEKGLKYIVILGSFLVVFVPLIVVPQSYFPYIIQKTVYLRILIEFIFGAYLILALWKPEYRPKKSLVLWTVLGYFAVIIISTFTSQSFLRSWWGNWERSLGTFNVLHYFVWFIALISVFKKVKYWNRLLNSSLIASLLIGLYSIAQRLGFSFILQTGLERVNGTLGNASFLASYMLLHIFLALFFFAEKKAWNWKIYYLAIALIDLFVLFLTGTRGALLALFASVIGFLVLVFWQGNWKKKSIKVLIGIFLMLMISLGVLFSFKDADFVKENYLLRRVTGFSLEDNTIQTRLHSWSWGIKGFRDNLLIGVGPENFQIVFNKYFEADFYDYSKNEIWFDRAHNTLVDQAATLGIFGFLFYLFIFGSVIYYLFEFKKKGFISPITFMVLILLFFSYFVQNMFVFDSLNTYIVFFLLLAYIHFLSIKTQKDKDQLEIKEKKSFSVPLIITLPIISVLIGLLIYTVNVNEIKANDFVYGAYVSRVNNEYEDMVKNYEQAKAISINKFDTAVVYSSNLNEYIAQGINIPKETKIKDIKQAVDWMNEAIEYDQNNMFLYYLQAKNYSSLAEFTGDSEYLYKGIEYAEKAHELSPDRIRPYWLMAQIYLFGGQPEVALEKLDKAVELNSNIPETHYYKAVIYKSTDNDEKFYEEYDKIIDKELEFFTLSQITDVIAHYDNNEDIKRLIFLVGQMTILEPYEPNNWDKYADLLTVDKQYDKALKVLLRAAEVIPSYSSRAYDKYQNILKLIEQENETSNE